MAHLVDQAPRHVAASGAPVADGKTGRPIGDAEVLVEVIDPKLLVFGWSGSYTLRARAPGSFSGDQRRGALRAHGRAPQKRYLGHRGR